jgi:CheY-like chemotaxis protein
MSDTAQPTNDIVLVVEDETLVRVMANDLLTEAGYRVLEARDGQEALTILEVHPDIRALFTDVTMPNLDGNLLAKIVTERWPHVGIVVTSGLPRPGCGIFVSKPYTFEDVAAAVKRAIADTAHLHRTAEPLPLPDIIGGQPS